MNREKFDQSFEQALGGAFLFALLGWGLSDMPTDNLFLQIAAVLIFVFMILINLMMLMGFTSFQYKNTQLFYSFVLPIYPVILIVDNFVWHYEWWHYLIIIIAVCISCGILGVMFENKIFARSVECIFTTMFLFSSPFLYSHFLSWII